jgi:hypothetical protein
MRVEARVPAYVSKLVAAQSSHCVSSVTGVMPNRADSEKLVLRL